MLTPDDVHNVAFSRPSIGKRGYDQEEVDEFLDLLEAALRGTGARVTGDQVREVLFSKPPIGKRGYNEDEVDEFLDLAAAHLDGKPVPARTPAPAMPPAPASPPAPQAPPGPLPGMVEPKKRWWKR